MAIAFANIFMATIENQTLRQSCIEQYPAHQKNFFHVRRDASVSAVGRQIFGRRQKSLEAKAREKIWEKKAYRVGHYKDFTEPETYP